MKKIDKLIKYRLLQKASTAYPECGSGCLSEAELHEYLSDTATAESRGRHEKHISECLLCLDRLVQASDGKKLHIRQKLKASPHEIEWRAKNIYRLDNAIINSRIDLTVNPKGPLLENTKKSEIRKAVIGWFPKKLRKNKWLIASATAFALSFAFPPVFLQFLLAAGIFGGKWIFDSENARTLVMIYNAWKKGGEKEAGEMIETLKTRIPVKNNENR